MTSEMLQADKYLSIVNDRGKASKPLSRVYRNMRQPEMFLKAYANLYSNAGATTTGADPNDTIQGMSLQRIETIIQNRRMVSTNGNRHAVYPFPKQTARNGRFRYRVGQIKWFKKPCA